MRSLCLTFNFDCCFLFSRADFELHRPLGGRAALRPASERVPYLSLHPLEKVCLFHCTSFPKGIRFVGFPWGVKQRIRQGSPHSLLVRCFDVLSLQHLRHRASPGLDCFILHLLGGAEGGNSQDPLSFPLRPGGLSSPRAAAFLTLAFGSLGPPAVEGFRADVLLPPDTGHCEEWHRTAEPLSPGYFRL